MGTTGTTGSMGLLTTEVAFDVAFEVAFGTAAAGCTGLGGGLVVALTTNGGNGAVGACPSAGAVARVMEEARARAGTLAATTIDTNADDADWAALVDEAALADDAALADEAALAATTIDEADLAADADADGDGVGTIGCGGERVDGDSSVMTNGESDSVGGDRRR